MKRLIRWIFFSNLLPNGKELAEIAWVGGMGVISALIVNVGLALAEPFGDLVAYQLFVVGIVGLLWMTFFAGTGFGLVGTVVMSAGLSLVAYGFNGASSAWSLPETMLGFWMTLRCFSVGFKKRQ